MTIKITSIIAFLGCFLQLNAQTLIQKKEINDLPIIFLGKDMNIHIVSPEIIQFVDLSTHHLVGDLPSDNIARVKIQQELLSEETDKETSQKNFKEGDDVGIITLVGQSFLAQYRVIYQENKQSWLTTTLHIQPEEMQPLEFPKLKYSNFELKEFAHKILKKKIKKSIRKEKNLKLTMHLNNIYVLENYIFLDISIENETNLACDIEGFTFSIEDKKIYKATNNQSILLEPIFSLNNPKKFRKSYRNVFVFEKFTFPNSKILLIRMLEEQISGRNIDLKINYSDVLEADTF